MIFDLLTIKDLYKRESFYPHVSGMLPFNQNQNGWEYVKKYEIAEGCYFELKSDTSEQRYFTSLDWWNLEPSVTYTPIHSMKITYRSNRGIYIEGRGYPAEFSPVYAKASDTFKTISIILNNTLANIGYIDIWDASRFDSSIGYQKAGDYLIIKKIELLLI